MVRDSRMDLSMALSAAVVGQADCSTIVVHERRHGKRSPAAVSMVLERSCMEGWRFGALGTHS